MTAELERPVAIPGKMEYNRPRLWKISGVEFYDSVSKIRGAIVQQRGIHVGVVALSLDRAYTAFREKYPLARVDNITITDQNIDYIVDDPLTSRVAEMLEGGSR
jgi:hypothetical protein